MTMERCKQKAKGLLIISNDRGLHTRPSTELVKCASRYKAQISLIYEKIEVNAKSILGVLTLAAERGAKVRVEASGDDAEEAVAEILALGQRNFNIKY